jgi:hypothetical protein
MSDIDRESRLIAARPSESLDGHDVLLAFVALAAVALMPVFLVQVAPLSDWVNHLARMHVMAVGASDPYLSKFYSIDWQLIPNLAMDVVVPPLARIFGVIPAGQMFMAVTVLLMVTGPFAVQRAVYGRINAFPLVVFLFLYNDIFLVGLANYLFGVGLAVWGLAVWIRLRPRGVALRLAVSFGFVAATYVSHLYAAGVYGLAIAAYEIDAWIQRGRPLDKRMLADLLMIGVPFLPMLPLLAESATWGLAGEYQWDLHGKIDAVLMTFSSYSDLADISIATALAVAFVIAWRRGVIRFHRIAGTFLVVSGAVFLIMPSMLFGSYMADQRMPIAIVLVLVGFGRLNASGAAVRTGFLALVIACSALRIGDVAIHWARLAQVYDDFRRAFAAIPRGAKILVADADEPEGWEDFRDAIAHAACLAMIDRSALVSRAFTVKGKQIMSVRPEFHDRVDTEDGDPPTISRLLAATLPHAGDTGNYWDNWLTKHDYVAVLYTARRADNPNPDFLTPVYDGLGYQLYKVKRPAPAATGAAPAPAAGREGSASAN